MGCIHVYIKGHYTNNYELGYYYLGGYMETECELGRSLNELSR